MPMELLRDAQVCDADQMALVDKYVKLRTTGDVSGVLELVTDDIELESAFASAKGKGMSPSCPCIIYSIGQLQRYERKRTKSLT